jgi:hypothetical protein
VPILGGLIQWQITSRRARRQRDGYSEVALEREDSVVHNDRYGRVSGATAASSFITRTIMNRSNHGVEQPTPEMYRPYDDDDKDVANSDLDDHNGAPQKRTQIESKRVLPGSNNNDQEMVTISIGNTAVPNKNNNTMPTTTSAIEVNDGTEKRGAKRTPQEWQQLKIT